VALYTGIRIIRPDTPATVLIGDRRHKVKVPRLLKTSRGASFPHIADTISRKNYIVQVIPVNCRFVDSADAFAGPYRLRIRYNDIYEVQKKKVDGEEPDEDDDDAPKFNGPMRLQPITLRITGSDGYLGVWTEEPVEESQAKFDNNLYYCYRGILETGQVPEAEYGIQDTIQLRGVDGSERADVVEDGFDLEFLAREGRG